MNDNALSAASLAQEMRGVVGKLKRRLRAQASAGDLTPSQSSVLLRLERDGPQTTSGLARAEAMRSQSMRTIVAALQAADLVTGVPDPTDGRQTILTLSDTFRERLKTGRAARQDWLTSTIQTRLTRDEQRQLEEVLPLLRRLADD
ncbi:MarR family winged helix-turn-helix transcriptional regulator [Salinisphaera sp. Q1T1-3]|uniref:MarR family winged helix-turn-helix transcriptional regulator n=1 Tax=Salinisphaera sp. Q1T1-3 TaxID=2321229 RepID=UPI000E7312DC|nr:MarR family transcriptional regulator [Salinisphaera sp. Q1T1-3]RJS94885.1 MarR family transcriptional regulator [Salinisphaera sp. Q1T1-3]